MTRLYQKFHPSRRLFYTARAATCVMAARYTAEMVLQMLDDGDAVMGLDSESDISDDEDPDYCPGGSGSRPPGNPTEQDQSDSEDSSSVSNRMSRKGSYWSELPPTQGRHCNTNRGKVTWFNLLTGSRGFFQDHGQRCLFCLGAALQQCDALNGCCGAECSRFTLQVCAETHVGEKLDDCI
ncbi:unnamed protein product [Pleuronectes platessa]|uniref:Uncharacterized protein n=1 Tax=Pleuronectes platessa TaxID=8262 RepID=A0A9N7UW41_PLEPL|nr:unnamed protein product [Pleuronectes platessa]